MEQNLLKPFVAFFLLFSSASGQFRKVFRDKQYIVKQDTLTKLKLEAETPISYSFFGHEDFTQDIFIDNALENVEVYNNSISKADLEENIFKHTVHDIQVQIDNLQFSDPSKLLISLEHDQKRVILFDGKLNRHKNEDFFYGKSMIFKDDRGPNVALNKLILGHTHLGASLNLSFLSDGNLIHSDMPNQAFKWIEIDLQQEYEILQIEVHRIHRFLRYLENTKESFIFSVAKLNTSSCDYKRCTKCIAQEYEEIEFFLEKNKMCTVINVDLRSKVRFITWHLENTASILLTEVLVYEKLSFQNDQLGSDEAIYLPPENSLMESFLSTSISGPWTLIINISIENRAKVDDLLQYITSSKEDQYFAELSASHGNFNSWKIFLKISETAWITVFSREVIEILMLPNHGKLFVSSKAYITSSADISKLKVNDSNGLMQINSNQGRFNFNSLIPTHVRISQRLALKNNFELYYLPDPGFVGKDIFHVAALPDCYVQGRLNSFGYKPCNIRPFDQIVIDRLLDTMSRKDKTLSTVFNNYVHGIEGYGSAYIQVQE